MKYVNIVRRFLIAGNGRKVIDADYESLEPHCFASVTGDKKLQERGVKIHSLMDF